MACGNFDCLSDYSCSSPNEPLDGAIFAPFVELTILGEQLYTVGNNSSPNESPNAGDASGKTAIKSFQYGFGVASSGVGAKIELVSEGGESYLEFAKAINKTISNAVDDTKKTHFRYGWIIRKCDGSVKIDYSPQINLMIKTMQTSYDSGTIKITIECIDLLARHFERRIEGNFGSDDEKHNITDAIGQLFGENDPEMNVRLEPDDEFGWKYGDKDDGPYSKWPGDQQNAVSVLRKWLSGQVTYNDKGTIIQYDPQNQDLVIREDPKPGKNEKNLCNCPMNNRSLGTYIVNGGNCSNVLSFTPTVDWILFNNNAGGTTGSGYTGISDQKAAPDIEVEKAGPEDKQANGHNDIDWSSTDSGPAKNQEATAAQSRANKDYEIKPGLEAELKIMGDPSAKFANPVLLAGSNISIVMINPYMVDRCTWISDSMCNKVLSNKRWLVLGAGHQIEGGKYTTTIKVKLDIPGSDIAQGLPLGGEGCGTFTFDNDKGTVKESL